tara:strand:+ start:1769 stop:3154 length:1386 start_codon:yes stop_codon:yes gene_type:complete
MSIEFSIVGGGIAGLVAAKKLAEKGYSVHLYEKEGKFGGRLQTVYEDGEVLYEAGAWRILKNHKRFQELVKELDLTLIDIDKKIQWKGFKAIPFTASKTSFPVPPVSLTKFQEKCLHQPIPLVDQGQQKTGYDLRWESVYDPAYKRGESDETFFVIKEGMDEVINGLVRQLSTMSNVTLYPNHCIQDIRYTNGSYKINFTIRKENVYERHVRSTSYLVLAIPLCDLKKIKSLSIEPNLATVISRPLFHIMAKSKNIGKSFGKIIVNSPLSQTISTCYNNDWFQISYSAGRFAMLFHNLYLTSKSTWRRYLESEFYSYFSKSIRIDKIVPHFWRDAVHRWLPNYKTKVTTLSERNIVPHPRKYKNLYLIGECFSTMHAWTEGALKTVDVFMEIVQKQPALTKTKPKEYVIYDGRIINVSSFKHVHPGSRGAIEDHLFEDITDLWNQYHSMSASKYMIPLEER